MRGLVIYACLLTGLFYFSEGKPCPEKTRPHKTRCDAYYKCRELPSMAHVWVPSQCQEGLVYEHNVGSCVLPGEDWECITPSDLPTKTASQTSLTRKDANILIVNNQQKAGLLLNERNDDDDVQIVMDATLSSEEQEQEQLSNPSEEDISQFDSSGDGELVDLDGAQNREGAGEVSHSTSSTMATSTEHSSLLPTSPSSSLIDPQLTAHLQRLSQLIDGLQQTYQKTDKPQLELRPDQLNAFLAHFDLKNRYDMLNPLGNYKESPISSTTPMSITSTTTKLPEPTANKTRLQEHLTKHRMQPETKLMLSNSQPYSSYGPGYANSQIVVNRPEGSVLFTLPQFPNPMSAELQSQSQMQSPSSHSHSQEFGGDHEPKISEETLKTVLELSKQMIAAQNLPKVLPNPAYNSAYYAPPILQPVILAPHSNPYQQQYYAMQGYEPAPAHYGHHHKNSASYHNSNKKQPSTTIIHNNVIPVHLSSTSSGEKEMLDAYGNSLGHFPNLDKHALSSNNNNIDNNNYYNKFIATMTTARPSIAVTTMSSQFGAPAPAYGGEFTLTTPRPFEQQPSPATVANFYTASPHLNEQNVNQVYQSDSYPTGYPMTVNIQRPMNSGSAGLFPAQLEPGQVKIRPNAEKIESMEMDTDENNSNNNRHNLLTYSSSSSNLHGMSQQLAPEPYVEQQSTAQFMVRPTPSVSSSIYSDAAGNVGLSMFSSTGSAGPNLKLKRPPGASAGFGQLVNFNGNFISLDVFQKSIMPLLTQSPAALSQLSNVEVISCQAGVRQANQTDCTRYFVCSKKDGKVLSYACPPYTGFNQQTRICDAQTYAQCGNVPSFAGYSIDENRRLQLETLKMLSEAKRRQEAALKAQSIANLLQQYGQSPSAASPMSAEQNMLDSYMVSFPEPQIIISTPRPTPATPTLTPISHSGSGSVKKRKYYCKEGDKIPDQTSIASYFVCYKNAQGQMKGHKMTCSKGLVFCPSTLLCTLASKCNS